MGLQCSILGHAFEPAGVEREREEEGEEVVTTERELERCRRCGTERVVSESTEVTAVVDGESVGLEDDTDADADVDAAPDVGTEPSAENDSAGEAMAGVVDRTGVDVDEEDPADAGRPSPPASADDAETGIDDPAADSSIGGELIDSSPSPPDEEPVDDEPPDPESEDTEILTAEEDPDRDPGEWPDDPEDDDTERVIETDTTVEAPEEESLSGITVPEGEIVCPECGFRVEAHSGYRDGDSCPECNAWLEAERNQ